MQVVWFKRDLRVQDHAALSAAAERGPLLALYIAEPELWQQPDASGRQWAFVAEALTKLDEALAHLGSRLIVRTGTATEILSALHAETPITALLSHEETGNLWTYARDRAVQRWCTDHTIPWHQFRQNGVVRRLQNRNRWAAQWNAFMQEPQNSTPRTITGPDWLDLNQQLALPHASELGLADDPCPGRQEGHRAKALKMLDTFYAYRGRAYQREMSSPLTAFEACSRISPHLAWGTVSMREVAQSAFSYREKLSDDNASRKLLASGMNVRAVDAFIARLHWHCHFMQKLEDEPEIEVNCLHPYAEDLRTRGSYPERLAAWQKGETGFPFIDACMRALNETGWINFRMRAMLTAFASYHLWLDWRDTGPHLAQQFTDYEPGIHWSQIQMQSGTTGINTPRMYNPVKQSLDQDPNGQFIAHYVPELRDVPAKQLHEPWKQDAGALANAGVRLCENYPMPIVDHQTAAREARQKISAMRKRDGYWELAQEIVEKHASRKRPARGPDWPKRKASSSKRPVEAEPQQLRLDI